MDEGVDIGTSHVNECFSANENRVDNAVVHSKWMSIVHVLESMKHFRGSHHLISRQVTNTKTVARQRWHNLDHQIIGLWESIWGKLCHTEFSWCWYCCTWVRESWHAAQLEQKILDKMTDHRVSDFVFKKSHHVVAPDSKHFVMALSDRVIVNPLLLLQQCLIVGYDSREVWAMCLSSNTIWGNWNHAAIRQIILSKSIKFHGKRNRDMCHYVESMQVCKNCEKQFCLIVVLLQKTTFIWDETNPLSVNMSYLQETWHAHMVCKEDFLSLQQSEQTEVHLFVGWWNGDTYWDWSEACSIVHNGGSPLQLQNWMQHQTLPLSIFCTDQCTKVTLDPWWDGGNVVLQGHCQNFLSVNIAKFYIFPQSW